VFLGSRMEVNDFKFTYLEWLKDASPWLELYFCLHLLKTAILDSDLTANLQFTTVKRSNSVLLHHLVRNGFFDTFREQLASSCI
jgi:hypothetical protein